MSALSGEQFELSHGDLHATVSELGATLREFSVRGVPVVWGFPSDSLPIGSAGQVLAPWPNRLDAGAYEFDGVRAAAAIDEPRRNNSIHGLVRWLFWERVYEERDRVKLHCSLGPQPGYPFRVALSVQYALSADGLEIGVEAEAERDGGVPFGVGFHPYFLGGPSGLKGSRLQVRAARHLLSDERALPVGDEPVSGQLSDLQSEEGLLLDDVDLDDCFHGLVRDPFGQAVVRFVPGSGEIAEVTLRLDEHFDYLMCYTGGTLAPEYRRQAVALEPMTCAPNAFNSGDGLLRVSASSPFRAAFSITAKLAAR